MEQKLGYELLPAGDVETRLSYKATKLMLNIKGGTLLVAGVTLVMPTRLTNVVITKEYYTVDGERTDQVFNHLDEIQFAGLLQLHTFTYETNLPSLGTLEELDYYFSRKLKKDTWLHSTDKKRQKAIYMATDFLNRHQISTMPDTTRIEVVARLVTKFLEGWIAPEYTTIAFLGLSEKSGKIPLAPDTWPDVKAYQLASPYYLSGGIEFDRVN